MFPEHCKEVSVRSVDFQLTEENILRFLSGKNAYIRTKYFVLNSGDTWAVAAITKRNANSVLQPIESVRILALPSETRFVRDPSLEVLSATKMGMIREQTGSHCVVVKGRSEHISFFVEEAAELLTVFDVVPPAPSKLVSMVDQVLESELQDRFVKREVIELDLNDIAAGIDTPIIMFPCRASGLSSEKEVMYLDETRELDRSRLDGVTLVGCSLSARIFKAIYGREPKLVNICPRDLAKQRNIQGPMLVKCCKVKEGFEQDGDMVIVPWGTRMSEVADALRAVLG